MSVTEQTNALYMTSILLLNTTNYISNLPQSC